MYIQKYQYPYMPVMDPRYFLMQVRPAVRHGLDESKVTSIRHAMTQVALISYLMGMGYDYYDALMLVESWEIDEMFPGERMI
ncbi:hypothetical protein CLPU_5c02520 [Gottschalkia purinilytica]|uniref:Uncharacterized protein n=1 Tax=Gottschalkia purinilytica TaxID=1503 RepID=A0A0L0WC00_GOTPU|nr:hypothetical protein CLPU_5c02520 [Gottschalkia purinilytica]